MSLAVVVVSYNVCELTRGCLASVFRALSHAGTDGEVWVVDNASTDGSAEMVAQTYPQAILLALDENLGYAGGNNVGVRYALDHGADAVLILNNDILVAPDFLEPLLDAALPPAAPAIVTAAVCEMARRRILN